MGDPPGDSKDVESGYSDRVDGSNVGTVQRTLTLTDGEEDDTKGLLQDIRLSSVEKKARNDEKLKPGLMKSTLSGSKRMDTKTMMCNIIREAKVSSWHMILGTKMNVLLVCIPVGIASHKYSWGSGVTAVLALLSLCPLAERLGFTTEQLALRTNDTLGALLNVTFGNATELILSIVALREAEILLIQMSLIGSILSNQLLVLGSAMVTGGVKHGVQLFERQSAVLHVALLVGSSVGLGIPALIEVVGGSQGEAAITWLSRFISVIMITVYGLFLYYLLKMQKKAESKPVSPPEALKFSILHKSVAHHKMGPNTSVHAAGPEDIEMASMRASSKDSIHFDDFETSGRSSLRSVHSNSVRSAHTDSSRSMDFSAIEGEEEEEEPVISTCSGVFWLGVVACLISYMSDILVANIENGAAEQLHIPPAFLYTIIVPIVGNAAEHTSALIFSYRNKPDIAFGIAVGSSVQIALLVIPACVLIAWPMKQPLSLSFGGFDTAVYAASVILLFTCITDGRSNWMKGALLIAAYFFISLGVWFV